MLHRVVQKALDMTVPLGPAVPEPEGPLEFPTEFTGVYAGGPLRVELSVKDDKIQVTMDGKSYRLE